jgi:hypothetical protein
VNGQDPITLPVLGDGCDAGTVSYGTAGSHPIHAASCAECGAAARDRSAFEEAAHWLRDHLASAHGIRALLVDLTRSPKAHRSCVDPEELRVILLLRSAWGDREVRPLAATWWAVWEEP